MSSYSTFPKIGRNITSWWSFGGYNYLLLNQDSDAASIAIPDDITGEAIEIYQTAKDIGINVIFAGHYATETLGVKALAVTLQHKFTVDTKFVDLPTGL